MLKLNDLLTLIIPGNSFLFGELINTAYIIPSLVTNTPKLPNIVKRFCSFLPLNECFQTLQ